MPESDIRSRDWIVASIVSAVLVVIVWWPLVNGAGLVGGDIYPYFFPQKQVVAESFANGSIPLWHHRTGLGYPLHAESQAAVFYPTTQILYRLVDIHSAYHCNLLLHYWLAFIFSWRLLRCYRIGMWPALFGAMIFIYGWFPARVSLEWSIIGGVYFPLCLWQTEEFIRRPSARRISLLSICLGLHLLAGHFALAFITQLSCLLYAAVRSWQIGRANNENEQQADSRIGPMNTMTRNSAAVVASIGIALLLAAVQLLPTLELKRLSQRQPADQTAKAFDPAYGHMPPGYITQVFASWWGWHSAESVRNGDIFQAVGSVTADTNKVEAHLYWGLLPLSLMLLIAIPKIRRNVPSGILQLWLLFMLLATIYSTGWLMPITKHLPGFGFFMGPGRYLMVTAFGGSVIAAFTLDALLQRHSSLSTILCVILLSAVTLPDLLLSSQYVTDATPVSSPPLLAADGSWIKSSFQIEGNFEPRVLAPGPNIINLFGASGVPVYLGIGPSIYYTETMRPTPDTFAADTLLPSSVHELAITHVLTTEPLSNSKVHLTEPKSYPDDMLARIWGTSNAPYLYTVKQPAHRITSVPPEALIDAKLLHRQGESIEFEVNTAAPAVIKLAELMYPGWTVSINGATTKVLEPEGTLRTVGVPAGTSIIRWTYRPTSFQIGSWISFISLLITAAFVIFGPQRKKTS
ncbi:MAG: hypothetical protein ABJZ55_01805 [Fuerstiella sp.]